MVHTAQDYSTKYKMTTIFSGIDVYELAARLGAPNMHNRSGNVVFFDTFDASVLHWEDITGPGGGNISLSTDYALFGESSMRLATTGIANNYAEAARYIQMPSLGKIGVELSTTIEPSLSYIQLECYAYTGTHSYRFGWKYLEATNTLQVGDSTNGWNTIDNDFNPPNIDGLFHTIKLVVDLANNVIDYIIYSKYKVDCSAYSCQKTAIGTGPHIIFNLTAKTREADPADCYIDNFIVTQNET